MSYGFSELIQLIGCTDDSEQFKLFLSNVNDRPQIENDAELNRTYYKFKKSGFSIMTEHGNTITTAHLMGLDFPYLKDSLPYALPLPDGISFQDTAASILSKIGKPAKQGGGEKLPFLYDVVPIWLQYDRGTYVLHIQFSSKSNVVDLVTIMAKQAVPK